ncbi:unnamed protein product [Ceutorhynchus assimilis]|uniref:Chitin-binding type-4 domain-containing protein n=1 Tax=Ceutorhynchus assimilis TaxID=467358 RepID=A0A9N9MGX2_9CUCU|nr:unnamed protein product [Ceutorhynchus assimilis]
MSLPIMIIILSFTLQVLGHGYMYNPINRASRWRLNPSDWTVGHDYDDNQFFCGGFSVQYEINKGKCGPCGDDWRDPSPRSNENGGTYGNGIIVASYYSGNIIKIDIRITANHLGKISYQLCKLSNPNLPEQENCFKNLQLADGSYYQNIGPLDFNVTSFVQLPSKFICERCVLRWNYSAGNNWGKCANGTSAVGCGPQETFRSCADVRILPNFWMNYLFNRL